MHQGWKALNPPEQKGGDALEDTLDSGTTTCTLNIRPRVTVVGVGGAGCTFIDNIYYSQTDVETVAINTDRDSLDRTGADRKVLLCDRVTRGEGAKGDHALGRSCAMTHAEEIGESLRGTDIVFIVAGMGGGTGTGAAPVVAEISREMGLISFAIAINPFSFEQSRRIVARDGIRRLRSTIPLTMVMENDMLLQKAPDATMAEAFSMANAGIEDYISKSTRKVTSVFLEQLAHIKMDMDEPYGEWPVSETDTVNIILP